MVSGLGTRHSIRFHTSVAKGLKIKVRKVLVPLLTFVEVTGEKLVGGIFTPHPE